MHKKPLKYICPKYDLLNRLVCISIVFVLVDTCIINSTELSFIIFQIQLNKIKHKLMILSYIWCGQWNQTFAEEVRFNSSFCFLCCNKTKKLIKIN